MSLYGLCQWKVILGIFFWGGGWFGGGGGGDFEAGGVGSFPSQPPVRYKINDVTVFGPK